MSKEKCKCCNGFGYIVSDGAENGKITCWECDGKKEVKKRKPSYGRDKVFGFAGNNSNYMG